MLHVRMLVPTDLLAQVLALIDATVGVADQHALGMSIGVGEDHHPLPADRIGEYLSRS